MAPVEIIGQSMKLWNPVKLWNINKSLLHRCSDWSACPGQSGGKLLRYDSLRPRPGKIVFHTFHTTLHTDRAIPLRAHRNSIETSCELMLVLGGFAVLWNYRVPGLRPIIGVEKWKFVNICVLISCRGGELQVLPGRLDLQQRFIKGGRRAAAVRKANNERELAGKYDPRDERVDCPLLCLRSQARTDISQIIE